MSSFQVSAVDDLICAALRGECPSWPWNDDPDVLQAFFERCSQHGVQALLHARAPELPWPSALLDMLRMAALRRGIWEVGHLRVLRQALAALGGAGIQPVMFKGTALGYSVYADPVLRVRADTDLIIPASARIAASKLLRSLGFMQSNSVSCEFLSYEATFSRFDLGSSHHLDLHWRVHYSQMQANRFPYEVLLRDAQPLPGICAHALGVSPVHALLLVCLHRSNDLRLPQWDGNRAVYGEDRLIWIHDVHLLLRQMTREQIAAFLRQATQHGMLSLCMEPIQIAMRCFHTAVPDVVHAAFSGSEMPEIVARYQRSKPLQQRWADFVAIGRARGKLKYIAEHILPPDDYLRDRYPDSPHQSPIRLGLRRLLNGLLHRYLQTPASSNHDGNGLNAGRSAP